MIATSEPSPPTTASALDALETRIGMVLPVDYRAFLLSSNGGRPERDMIDVPGCTDNPVARIHFFFGVSDPEESADLEWNLETYSDRIPPGLLPIATTEGADKICLDLSQKFGGGVVYWDGYEHDGDVVYPIAASFSDLETRLSFESEE